MLRHLQAEEDERFVALHPTSAVLAKEARANLLGGVPMAWMTRWPGSFPIFFDSANGAHCSDVDGIEYIDFCLGDTGAMTGHGLVQVADALHAQALRGITTMLPSVDAAWVGGELARRFGLPAWQMAMTATDANRFVLRFARTLTGRPKVVVFDWCYHGSVDETLATLADDGRTIYLDRTLFYPSSGGQPFDLGTIAGVAVIDVVDEEDRIAHRLAAPLASQDEVAGEIDWNRRFDHMQQHSGQHLLSAVHTYFERLTLRADAPEVEGVQLRRQAEVGAGLGQHGRALPRGVVGGLPVELGQCRLRPFEQVERATTKNCIQSAISEGKAEGTRSRNESNVIPGRETTTKCARSSTDG